MTLELGWQGDPAHLVAADHYARNLATVLVGRPSWMIAAACRTKPTAMFFPERGQSVTAALAVCRYCAVRDLCLQYALDLGPPDHGILGGTTPPDRAAIRQGRDTL